MSVGTYYFAKIISKIFHIEDKVHIYIDSKDIKKINSILLLTVLK